MWLLILQFILNFPALLKTIMELWRLIKSLGDDDKKAAYTERLRELMKRCKNGKCVNVADQNEFEALRKEILENQ